jgi:hypothetical protein
MSREPNWKALHPWFRQAREHGQGYDSWFAVECGSPESAAWQQFFSQLGWMPLAVKEAIKLQRPWTAPCQWPQELGEAAPRVPATFHPD